MAKFGSFDSLHWTIVYYCFWSLFYALGPMIWFYPLNELDITGYEAFAAIWLIPVITASAVVRRIFFSEWGSTILEVGMLGGIYSFQMPSTLSRLEVLSIGNGAGMLYLCSKLFSGTRESRVRQFWLLLGSHFLFLSSRVAMTSIAPAWADHRTNGIVFGVFALHILTRIILKSVRSPPFRNKENTPSADEPGRSTVPSAPAATKPEYRAPRSRQFLYGLLTGSLFYLTHWVFGELGVLSRWVVRGATDPPNLLTPFYTSPLVLVALIIGVFLPYSNIRRYSSVPCWIVGVLAFFGTYFLNIYAGFVCGLVQ